MGRSPADAPAHIWLIWMAVLLGEARTPSRSEASFGSWPRAQCPGNLVAVCNGLGAFLVAGSWILVSVLDSGEGQRKIKQSGKAILRKLAGTSSRSPANGSL